MKKIKILKSKDIMISTGPQLVIKDINRHSHTEYECVARNSIEPDPSRHFKINVNCNILNIFFKKGRRRNESYK